MSRKTSFEEKKRNAVRTCLVILPSLYSQFRMQIQSLVVCNTIFNEFYFRFRMSEPLRNITIFVESKGYSLDTHRIWTSDLPMKNVVR